MILFYFFWGGGVNVVMNQDKKPFSKEVAEW